MRVKELNGKYYHCDYEGNLVTNDYNGGYIESHICICAAHSSYECVCGAWDIPLDSHENPITDNINNIQED